MQTWTRPRSSLSRWFIVFYRPPRFCAKQCCSKACVFYSSGVFLSSPTCPKLWMVKTDWATTRGLSLFRYLASSANFHLLAQTCKQQSDLGILNEADFHLFLHTADACRPGFYSSILNNPKAVGKLVLDLFESFWMYQSDTQASELEHMQWLSTSCCIKCWNPFLEMMDVWSSTVSERTYLWKGMLSWNMSQFTHRSLTQLKQLC